MEASSLPVLFGTIAVLVLLAAFFLSPAGRIYVGLVKILYPLARLANAIASGVARLLRITAERARAHSHGVDAMRSVTESALGVSRRHRQMLTSILDLEKVAVEDIMIPRTEISGLDLKDDWDDILEQLRSNPHTRLPVFEADLDHVLGILHVKKVSQALARGDLTRDGLRRLALEREPVFVPAGTTLNNQLLAFQQQRRRMALIVNEYGDVQGLVTLEDILEEIVGEFTSDPASLHRDIHRDGKGGYVVSAGVSVRTLNRKLGWALPVDGPRTLNGLIIEYLETIPEPGTSLKIGSYAVEILQTAGNAVKTARVVPS